MHLSAYAKAITTLLTGLLVWGGQVVASAPNDFHVIPAQWLALAGVFVTAVLVFFVPNTGPAVTTHPLPLPVWSPDPPVVDNPGGGLHADG